MIRMQGCAKLRRVDVAAGPLRSGTWLIAGLLLVQGYAQAGSFVWSDPAGGLFKDPANWQPSNPPGPPGTNDSALFKLDSAPGYVVSFSIDQASDKLVVTRDRVTFDFLHPGLEYSLGNAGIGVTVGQNNNDAGDLTITRGTLAANAGVVGDATGAYGIVHVSGAAARWSLASDLTIARFGSGEVDVTDGAELDAATVRVNALGALNLNAGGALAVANRVTVHAGTLTRDAGSAFGLGTGATLVADQSARVAFAGATTIAAGTYYDLVSGSTFRSDGALTVAGALNINGATADAGGSDGANGSAGSNGLPPRPPTAGTAGHGVLLLPAGVISLDNGALLSTRGGNGGAGTLLTDGTAGASAGDIELGGGLATVAGGSTLDLRGGKGGRGGSVADSGNGGDGGDLRVTGGRLALVGGRVLLGAGAGGGSSLGSTGNPGSAGSHGQVVVSGGQVDLHAGLITTDANASATDPVGLIGASMSITGGTLNFFDDVTLDGGKLARSADAAVMLAAGKRLTVRNGGELAFTGPSELAVDRTYVVSSQSLFRSAGNLTVAGQLRVDDALLDATGEDGRNASSNQFPSVGATGASVRIDPLASLQLTGSGGLVARGGRGGKGNLLFGSAAGGVGGSLIVAGGTVSVGGGAAIDLRGGAGGEGAPGVDTPAGNVGGVNGGNGGRGGRLAVSGGTLSIDGGTVRVDGGARGVGKNTTQDGAAGSIHMSGGSVTLDHVVITGDAALTSTAPIALLGTTFNLTGGDLDTRAGRFGIAHANLLQSGGSLHASSIELEAGGGYEFSGGTLSVASFIGNLYQTGGTLAPGNSPGLTVVSGDYGLEAPASIRLELAGTSRGIDYDALDIGGHFSAGGTLEITLLDGFVPDVGTLFKLFAFGSASGDFDRILLPTLPAGLRFDTSGLATKGTLFVMATPVPLPAPIYLLICGGALLMRRVVRTASAQSACRMSSAAVQAGDRPRYSHAAHIDR